LSTNYSFHTYLRNIVCLYIWVSVFCIPSPVNAQETPDVFDRKLNDMGFENIRSFSHDNQIVIALENNIYRWEADAIVIALDTIAAYTSPDTQISVYLLKNDIPQLHIQVPAKSWRQYRSGKLVKTQLFDELLVDCSTGEDWNYLKKELPLNSNVNKIDLVIYPQLAIQNRLLNQFYEIMFNIAPAVEVSLWKGMLFTGQIIFPLKNDFEVLDIKDNVDYKSRDFLYESHEGDYIQPGFVTISQDIRFPRQWFGNLTIGKFNAHRYGLNGRLNHFFKGNRWSIAGNAGLTGSSHFLQNQWVTGRVNTFSWQVTGGYFYPRFNLQFDLSYGSYLNKDKGFRAECSRHFGATTIGFYAMHTGGDSNGGFKFTIPFPTNKRNRKHTLRVTSPKYFDSDYNAGYAVYYGKDYETRPNENQTEHFNNPIFIKGQFAN